MCHNQWISANRTCSDKPVRHIQIVFVFSIWKAHHKIPSTDGAWLCILAFCLCLWLRVSHAFLRVHHIFVSLMYMHPYHTCQFHPMTLGSPRVPSCPQASLSLCLSVSLCVSLCLSVCLPVYSQYENTITPINHTWNTWTIEIPSFTDHNTLPSKSINTSCIVFPTLTPLQSQIFSIRNASSKSN